MTTPTPDEWARLSALVDEALDLPEEQREAWLTALAAREPTMAAQVAAFLAASDAASHDGFMKTPVHKPSSAGGAEGLMCGPYQLESLIGRGGMGSVWRGRRRDGRYDGIAAVKLLSPSLLGDAGAARFRREGEILGRLRHPNIAQLFDAGVTDEGQPYLVLEYIDGVHLDVWCREQKLDARGRIRLFLDVIAAVAHAHTNLVVHRDLKPSNILVDRTGVVKLLDFGIAKWTEEGAADGGAVLTQEGRPLMTPLYASPEQVTAGPVTTATDVYALGVLLFELLTATRPYRIERDLPGSLERAIVTAEPLRPSSCAVESTNRRSLQGDLDTILLKALRKDPSDRYPTVTALGDDLLAWLERRPIKARPTSLSYRVSRFVRRNVIGVVAGAAVLVAVLGGAGVSLWQAQRARAEQARAEEITRFVTGIFRDADPYNGDGKKLSATDLLVQANTRLSTALQSRRDVRLELQALIASSLASLQEYEVAEPLLQRVVREGDAQYGATDSRALNAWLLLASAHRFRGNLDAQDSVIAHVLANVTRQPVPDSLVIAAALLAKAHHEIDRGRANRAVAPARDALTIADENVRADEVLRLTAAQVYAVALDRAGQDRAEALRASQRAMELTTARYGGKLSHPRVVEGQLSLGMALTRAGRQRDALVVLARADSASVVGMGAENFTRAFIRGAIGLARLEIGQERAALADFNESLRLFKANGDSTTVNYAINEAHKGNIHLRLHQPNEAIPSLRTALVRLQKAIGSAGGRVVQVRIRLALATSRRGNADAAWRELEALSSSVADSAVGSPITRSLYLQAQGEVQRGLGRGAEAVRLLEEALRVRADTTAVVRAPLLVDLGLALADAGDSTRAIRTLRDAIAAFRRTDADLSASEALAQLRLGQLLLAQGERIAARAQLESALSFWNAVDPNSRHAREARRSLS